MANYHHRMQHGKQILKPLENDRQVDRTEFHCIIVPRTMINTKIHKQNTTKLTKTKHFKVSHTMSNV